MLICRRHSVPLILCNYDGFYDGLIRFFKSCDTNGTLAARELKDIILADSNDEVTSDSGHTVLPALKQTWHTVMCLSTQLMCYLSSHEHLWAASRCLQGNGETRELALLGHGPFAVMGEDHS